MSTISKFYKRLRDLCEERDMTINELVRDLGLSSGSPTAWKNGTVPRSSTLIKISSYFDVTTDYLTGASDLRLVPLFEDVGGAKISHKEDNKKAPTLTEKNERNSIAKHMNVLRIAGRDGSFVERYLTDSQLAAVKAIIDQMPDASDDL